MIEARRRPLRLAAFAALVALAAAACGGNAHERTSAQTGERARAVAPGHYARLLGPADPAEAVRFSAVLRSPHAAALQRFLDRVSDPSSRVYGKYLAPADIGRRFGLPRAAIARAERRLEAAGVHVLRDYPQRTALDLRSSVAALRRVFGVRMGAFVSREGRRFHAPLTEPVIPAELRGVIDDLAGLNTGAVPAAFDVPAGGLRPESTATAYGIDPLHEQGLHGEGQTMAIISFASFRPSDVAVYDQTVGIQALPVKSIPVNGGSQEKTTPNSGEVNLDIDVVRSIVPQAQILNYEVPLTSISSFTSGVSDVINRIVQDSPQTGVQIASMSWGLCDVPQLGDGTPWLSAGDRAAAASAFKAARAAGISVFIASGDAGAFGCQRFLLSDHRPTATWPGDVPDAISVGGTLLSVREDGTYLEETGWEDQLEASGGGGGLNPQDPIPSYQKGVQLESNGQGLRQFPDVSAAADPDSGFFTVSANPDTGEPEGNVVGGTSAATPFWAASMVLVQQLAKQQGIERLGYLNDLFYPIAASADGATAFHDVVLGGNRKDNAGPGYDLSTGLGSPDVAELARAIVARLKSNPPA